MCLKNVAVLYTLPEISVVLKTCYHCRLRLIRQDVIILLKGVLNVQI